MYRLYKAWNSQTQPDSSGKVATTTENDFSSTKVPVKRLSPFEYLPSPPTSPMIVKERSNLISAPAVKSRATNVNINSHATNKGKKRSYDDSDEESEDLDDWVLVLTSLDQVKKFQPEKLRANDKLGSPIHFSDRPDFFIRRTREKKRCIGIKENQNIRRTRKLKLQSEVNGEYKGHGVSSTPSAQDDEYFARGCRSRAEFARVLTYN